jgi:fibronectin type 3 domain-containing protein
LTSKLTKLRRAALVPVAILTILFFGIVGLVLFRVAADQKPHRIVLTWKPSPPKPGATLAGYEIYRSQAGGPFKKLATGVTSPTYTDTQVKSGETYYYYVTAINPAGEASPASNRTDAVIP